ncbi:MAG TPA: TetR/AcrR family transcriptional regulator [Gemmatimonadales bacterium]
MPTPTHTRRDGEATRQRLLRAALELYTTIGFRATTTPAIAARAGVAEGTIYRHFSGKEHLLNEVYRSAQRWGAELVREPEGERPLAAAERLRALGRRILEVAVEDPSLARMLLRSREEQHLDERSREASREFRGALQEIVAEGRQAGQVREGPAELWSDLWLALVGFAAERLSAREWEPDSPYVGLTLDAAWDAIAAG